MREVSGSNWQLRFRSRSLKRHLAVIGYSRLREYFICKLIFFVTVFNLLAAMFSYKFVVKGITCTLFLGDNFP